MTRGTDVRAGRPNRAARLVPRDRAKHGCPGSSIPLANTHRRGRATEASGTGADRFDALAKVPAQRRSRRQFVKVVVGSAVGVLADGTGRKRASAADDCSCDPTTLKFPPGQVCRGNATRQQCLRSEELDWTVDLCCLSTRRRLVRRTLPADRVRVNPHPRSFFQPSTGEVSVPTRCGSTLPSKGKEIDTGPPTDLNSAVAPNERGRCEIPRTAVDRSHQPRG